MGRNPWIFGRTQDLIIFSGFNLLGIILGKLVPIVGENIWLFIFVDQSHQFLTYFFTYGFKSQLKDRGGYLLGILILGMLIFGSLYLWVGPAISNRIFVLTVIIHIARQQGAWFYILAAKAGARSKMDKLVDRIGITAATFGIILIYFADEPPISWFRDEDLFSLPQTWYQPLVIMTVISLLLYFSYSTVKAIKSKFQNIPWSKHLMLVNGAVVFTAGLHFQIPFVITFSHCIPYIYLSLTYSADRVIKNRREFVVPVPNVKLFVAFIYALAVLASLWYWYYEEFFPWFFAGISFVHIVIDSFFWKGSQNPEGRGFIEGFGKGKFDFINGLTTQIKNG